ncbi:MAG: dimethylmenaquinone methyltransferase [Phycisphaeraceae bacterium]|nr:dimethylmenaquinone methyltransferase [Phycisphaeraceae bacterium]
MIRESIHSAALADALDGLGFRHQSPRLPIQPVTGCSKLVGRCKTTLWLEFAYEDPDSYEIELKAVDGCAPDDVMICAANGSVRAAVWGELLSTAARNAGCVGAIVDGAVRDVAQMTAMKFPVFSTGRSVYDAMHRIKAVDLDVDVDIADVRVQPGSIVIADIDGVVVVPKEVEEEAIRKAWNKVHDENRVRDEIAGGMKASEAWERYGIL